MLDNAYAAIGASVLMHVAWNLVARQVEAKANFLWWGLLAHLVLFGPYSSWHLIHGAQWSSALVLALLTTSLAISVYFIALRRAYHFAPVALVYPLVRSAPVLIALWAWLIFAESLSAWEALAIGISVVGLWILAASSRHGDTRHALPWAAAAAFATSVYSLSDKVAIAYLPGFAEQLGFVTVAFAAGFVALSILQFRETGRWVPRSRPHWKHVFIGGLFIGTAYALVVRAMLYLPASHVVSFTNSGVVLAVILSITLYREREFWRQRLLGSLVVSAGLVMLGLKG